MCKSSKGFTLVELMIVVGILAIIAGFAVPEFSSMIKNGRLSSVVNDFNASLQLAKSESVARVSAVTVCKANGAFNDCVAGGNWNQGWIMFTDANGDASVNGTDTVLNLHEGLQTSGFTLVGKHAEVSNTITFNPSGTTSITTIRAIIACDDRGFGYSKGLIITITGRASAMKGSETGETTC
jgi:type IV fimbrial biogenesis protein FimT